MGKIYDDVISLLTKYYSNDKFGPFELLVPIKMKDEIKKINEGDGISDHNRILRIPSLISDEVISSSYNNGYFEMRAKMNGVINSIMFIEDEQNLILKGKLL